MEDWISHIVDFVRQHQVWAIPIVFAGLRRIVGVFVIIAAGDDNLARAGRVNRRGRHPFWPVFIAAAGGFFGDWLSYWLGDHYQLRVYHLWPFTRHPAMLERGHAFFMRWGIAGVFLGRFFGPLRAVVPLVAGLCGMPRLGFQLANLLSAALWAFGLLAPGAFGLRWLAHFVGQ
ncbi:Inner membrane protein YabI [Sodalis praecaptivus]